MKTLTKKEKVTILKKMRGLMNNPNTNCFCFAYSEVVYGRWDLYNPATIEAKLEELGLRKPKRLIYDYDPMWYSNGKRGTETRIRKIDEAIKRLEK